MVDNVLFSMDGTVLMCHPAAQTELVSTGVYTIPANVTKVAEYAFAYLSNLKGASLLPGGKAGGDRRLRLCLHAHPFLVTPDSVKTIGGNAFSFCESLTTPGSQPG